MEKTYEVTYGTELIGHYKGKDEMDVKCQVMDDTGIEAIDPELNAELID